MPTQTLAMARQPFDPLNVGIYAPGMAGALTGVSGQSIGQWARHGLIQPTVYHGRPANLYSYYDVAEAIVIRWLTTQGIKHGDIRLALNGVRARFPDWPLLHAPLGLGRLSLDDRPQLVRREEPGVYVDATGRDGDQVLITPALLDHARDMLAHGGWLADERGLKHIEVLPLKLGGAPSLRGKRWTVDHVARVADDPPGRQFLENEYGLESVEIDEAVDWMNAANELLVR